MRDENFTPEERGELLKLLRDTIAADRFPLSQRIRYLKSALAKLDPAAAPAPAAEPFPAPVPLGGRHDRAAEAARPALAGYDIDHQRSDGYARFPACGSAKFSDVLARPIWGRA
jgi:hypothetical protein